MAATHAAIAKVRARFLPEIPKWLADAPPEWSLVLPDGRVVMKAWWGAGNWVPLGFQEQSMSDDSRYGWWLYDKEGQLITATLPESYWFEATFPGFRSAVAGYAHRYTNVVEQWGRIEVYDMNKHDHHTYAVYQWDGTPLPVDQLLPEGQDGNIFQGIHGFDLPVIYAEQQRLTKTQ